MEIFLSTRLLPRVIMLFRDQVLKKVDVAT